MRGFEIGVNVVGVELLNEGERGEDVYGAGGGSCECVGEF